MNTSTPQDSEQPTRVRTLFLSDIHLGTRACRADDLLALLKDYDPEYLFLLGDIVDFWAMRRGVYWPTAHNTVVQKVLRKARHQTKVIYIPGNHDEALREYVGTAFGDISLEREYIHTAADGKRYLLLHGDEYDSVTHYHKWVSILGDVSYTILVHLSRFLSLARRKLGIPGHWSLADYAKRNVLQAVSFISDFQNAVVRNAKQQNVDAVICGHIHTPIIKEIDGITYLNTGDWVDSCSAIIEHPDGRMELIQRGVSWAQRKGATEPEAAAA